MKSKQAALTVVAGLALFWTGPAAAEAVGEHKYIGLKACGKCHSKELMGDQVAAWKAGPHAKAMKVLESEQALAVAKERGLAEPPHQADECVSCHATAHGLAKDQLDKGKPLKVKNAVQCESCHGPASGYRKNKTMSDRDLAISKGMWEPGKDEKICLACHNSDSPTFDVAKGFDFEAAKKEIAHPIAEEVKGRYLEAVKERKKAKAAAAAKDD